MRPAGRISSAATAVLEGIYAGPHGEMTGMAQQKNYITPQGLEVLKKEYHRLFHEERPKLVETIAWAASNGDRSENADYIYGKRRLREIDKRIGFLTRRLEIAEIVDPTQVKLDRIAFGATVRLEDEDGEIVCPYRSQNLRTGPDNEISRPVAMGKNPLLIPRLGAEPDKPLPREDTISSKFIRADVLSVRSFPVSYEKRVGVGV